MPRIILRLIQHLRENSKTGSPDAYKGAIQEADAFITMLLDFNNMGGLMRRVMTSALTNPQVSFCGSLVANQEIGIILALKYFLYAVFEVSK